MTNYVFVAYEFPNGCFTMLHVCRARIPNYMACYMYSEISLDEQHTTPDRYSMAGCCATCDRCGGCNGCVGVAVHCMFKPSICSACLCSAVHFLHPIHVLSVLLFHREALHHNVVENT